MRNFDIVAAIQQSGPLRDKALQQIYEDENLRKSIKRFIASNGGNPEDAEDVFQDTLILFDRQIRANRFNRLSSPETYFIGIAKWHWTTIQRKNGRAVELKPEDYEGIIESVEVKVIQDEQKELIEEILTKIGERCKTVLTLYKLSYSMKEIARELGLNSSEMAKKTAYECRKKFKHFVSRNAQYKTILKYY